MNAKVVRAVIGLWLMGLLVSPLAMAVELNFNISAPTSGTISYAGAGGALIGSNIEVDNVFGLSTPANANMTALCLSCALNFNTGALSGAGGSNPKNTGWWSFGSGGRSRLRVASSCRVEPTSRWDRRC